MKYFEILDPYYALLKAETQEEAIKKYVEIVADDEGNLNEEIREVSRDYALIEFSRGIGDNKKYLSPADLIKQFNEEGADVLLITGQLA